MLINLLNRKCGLLTALHMLVDALCCCCLYLIASGMDAVGLVSMFVIYNCVAFLTQPITGAWVDRIRTPKGVFVLSVSMLLVGGMMCAWMQNVPHYVVAVLIGLGNSMFHVYGGKFVAVKTNNNMRHLGIFVSTGALGLFLGGRYASVFTLYIIMGAMVAASALFLYNLKCVESADVASERAIKGVGFKFKENKLIIFSSVLFIVAFRSFLGNITPQSASYITVFPVLACLAAVAGKAFGGYLTQWFGIEKTLVVTLMLSGCCFLLGYYNVAFLLAMTLFINLSMPITLYLANKCCSRHEGFAFGMIAAFLIPGYAIGKAVVGDPFAYHLLYPLVATILIEALVLLALKERRWKVICSSVVINIWTNVPLNIYVNTLDRFVTWQDIILLESGVVVAESLLYYFITKDIRKSFLYGILCNLISYLIGFLYLYFV